MDAINPGSVLGGPAGGGGWGFWAFIAVCHCRGQIFLLVQASLVGEVNVPIGPWWGVMKPWSPLLSTCLCSRLLLLGRSVLTDRAMECVVGGFRLLWCIRRLVRGLLVSLFSLLGAVQLLVFRSDRG